MMRERRGTARSRETRDWTARIERPCRRAITIQSTIGLACQGSTERAPHAPRRARAVGLPRQSTAGQNAGRQSDGASGGPTTSAASRLHLLQHAIIVRSGGSRLIPTHADSVAAAADRGVPLGHLDDRPGVPLLTQILPTHAITGPERHFNPPRGSSRRRTFH